MTAHTRLPDLRNLIEQWAEELGFDGVAVTDPELQAYRQPLEAWLEASYDGEMQWLGDRKELRLNPDQLVEDTRRVIVLRMPYFQPETEPLRILNDPDKAYISRYALGRDYHKLMRNRLTKLAQRIQDWCNEALSQRPFVDSAPVLEKPLGAKAGLGWQGKNTLLLSENAGSWFFLGEIYTSLELPVNESTETDKCGKCHACMTVCPTDAFPEPYVLDATRCISYLTIENPGSIPEELRPKMGNRVFGCDDCQLVCPWNRDTPLNAETDFQPRHGLDDAQLTDLFRWTEEEFLERTAGSPIRRIGYEGWQRNLAVGLGNSSDKSRAIQALREAEPASTMVAEHIEWALNQLIEGEDEGH